jgi:8-oxo-dGTP pyrophosphatase MutT (NUDIX family)
MMNNKTDELKNKRMSTLTLHQLKRIFKQDLPGLAAQLKMAPPYRAEQLLNSKEKMPSARQSSVMILLFHDKGALKTVFIKRSEYDGVHSGQISFPGGQYELCDSSFEATALRETWEEIGVKELDIEIIGQLTDLYIPPSNFMVKVFVGYCTEKPNYSIDKREVQRVVVVELKILSESGTTAQNIINSSSVPCYRVENIEIWGATAMIISELLAIFKNNE